MTLRQKQSLFVELVAELIKYATRQGYSLTFGEAWRSPEEADRLYKLGRGIKSSLHTSRLAIDFNLFDMDGRWLTTTKAHEFLGLYWESLHPLCRWGGHFGDGNHYSLEHGGRK